MRIVGRFWEAADSVRRIREDGGISAAVRRVGVY